MSQRRAMPAPARHTPLDNTPHSADMRTASHGITIALPVQQCQKLFTPVGETLWVQDWAPRYLHPDDGRTAQGMVFMTGSADELTVWVLTEWSQAPWHARYARVTPASRWGFVDVDCEPLGEQACRVVVTYTMHALDAAGSGRLKDFESGPYALMIESWKTRIDERLDTLRAAVIP